MLSIDTIPAELKARRQWVLWSYEQRDGGETKVPKRADGRKANVSKAATWASFDEVVAAYERGGFDGCGYVFTRDDPYVGIDLDGCIAADGTLQTWGREWVDQLATYCEVSPSGTGLKLIARAVPSGRTGRKASVPGVEPVAAKVPGIEFCSERRFFTLTGQVWEDFGAIADAQEAALAADSGTQDDSHVANECRRGNRCIRFGTRGARSRCHSLCRESERSEPG
jgi:putative DNA primase/helicase